MPGRKASEEERREDILRAAYEVAARHGVEALTVRAVAARAAVSHGTVLFHFKRRNELVASLLDRVLETTTELRVPEALDGPLRPVERMAALLRAEMERLSRDPRHFRLFLEYWALGVRHAPIRRKVSAAIDGYREAFRTLAAAVAKNEQDRHTRATTRTRVDPRTAPDGLAALAVSLVHGCALQAVIDPKGFSVHRHFETAAHLFERLTPPQLAGRGSAGLSATADGDGRSQRGPHPARKSVDE
jgi:AcrR family transcriptional regulator